MTHVRLLNKSKDVRPDVACGYDICVGIDINDSCRYRDYCAVYDAAGCSGNDYCIQDWMWW